MHINRDPTNEDLIEQSIIKLGEIKTQLEVLKNYQASSSSQDPTLIVKESFDELIKILSSESKLLKIFDRWSKIENLTDEQLTTSGIARQILHNQHPEQLIERLERVCQFFCVNRFSHLLNLVCPHKLGLDEK